MAIGFRAQTQIGSGGATDPTSAPSLPSGTATGDMVLLFVIVKYASTTINTPTDWTPLNNGEANNTGLTDSGNDAGNVRAKIFWREKDAGWSTMPTVDLSGAPNCTMVGAISYSKGAGETWATPEGAGAADNSGGTTGIDPAASGTTISFASGDWFGSFAAVNGDAGTLGTHTATVAGVTFGTQNTRLNATTSSGTDLRGHSVDKTYTSGTASAGPDGSLSLTTGASTGAGVMVFYKLGLSTGATITGVGSGAATASGTVTGTPVHKGTLAGAATASGTITGTVTPAVHGTTVGAGTASGTATGIPVRKGILAGAATASGTASGYQHPPGPFTVDFSAFSDGPVPIATTGLRDAFLDIPASQDEMGIRSGKLAVVNFRGPDQDFTAGGGRRGLLWRNTTTLTDNVSGVYDGSMYAGVDPALPAFGPTLHISTDPADQWLGISAWFVPPPFSWGELGVIGWEQENFSYLDMAPGLTYPTSTDDVRLRSVDGMVSVEINGVTILGPCEIPAEILGSPVHGIQMDVQLDTDEELGVMEGVIIEADSTPLIARSAPLTPGVGTQVEVASATTINVPYPSTVVAGETLFCIVCTRNGGTISAGGWTDVPTSFGGALNTSIRVIRKTATGSESGNLTVTKSTAGVMAGVMVRASGDQPDKTSLTGQYNGTASTSIPTPVSKILGPRRTMIWIGATSIDTGITVPTDFTPLSAGISGGQAIRMAVGVALVDALSDAPASPYNAYDASNMGSRTGTAASSAASAAGFLLMFPAYGVAAVTVNGTGAGAGAGSGVAVGKVTHGGTLVGAGTGSGVVIGKVTRKGVLVGAATASGVSIGKVTRKGVLVGAGTSSGTALGTVIAEQVFGVAAGTATASGVVVGKVTRKGVLSGAATGSGTAIGTVIAEQVSGVAVGAGTGTGVVVGKVTRKGILVGAATSSGTALGTVVAEQVFGVAAGAATGSGVAIGKVTRKGVLAGAGVGSGIVVGKVTRKGTLVGAATGTGVIVGKVTRKGVAVGAGTSSGIALGTVVAEQVFGIAAGASSGTGVAISKVTRKGVLVGAATGSGTAIGTVIAEQVFGVASGGASSTGVSIGKVTRKGVLLGAASGTGTVTGKVTRRGVAVGAGTGTGSAFGSTAGGPKFGFAVGSGVGTGVVIGRVTRKGVLTGAGVGSGVVVAKVTHTGITVGAGTASGSAIGKVTRKGVLLGAATGNGTVTGKITRFGVAIGAATSSSAVVGGVAGGPKIGRGDGAATGTGTATGKVTRKGVLVGAATSTGVAVGRKIHLGISQGISTSNGIAIGKVTRKAVLVGASIASGTCIGKRTVFATTSTVCTSTGLAAGQRRTFGYCQGHASSSGQMVAYIQGSFMLVGVEYVDALYLGDQLVDKVMRGSKQVWSP